MATEPNAAAEQRVHDPMLAGVAACEGDRGATPMPPPDAPSSAQLPAGARWQGATLGAVSPRRRLFVAVEPLTDYYAEALATGAVAAIESGTFRLAPSGAMLLTDSPDGTRGVVVAERQGDGWVLTGGAAS